MRKNAFLILAAISILMLLATVATLSHNATRRSNGVKLYEAMKENDSAKVRELIDQGADIDSRGDPEKYTPLMLACINKNTELAKLLVEKGADVNSSDINKITPLSYAALHGKPELVSLLIEKGADVNNIDLHGNTPLYYAAAKGKLKVAKLLIEKGANVNIENTYGYTPLDIAYANSQLKIVTLLTKKGAKGTLASNQAATLQEVASVDAQDKSNTPAECGKLIAALKACDQTGGFMAMGCKAVARSQFDCPAVAQYMH